MINAAESQRVDVSFTTTRFGPITVAADKVIRFVKGIPGFERLRKFILIDHDPEGVFKWLQSVDDPAVAFLLTDPRTYTPGYAVPLRKTDAQCLGQGADALLTLVMVCVNRDERKISLNLKGPLIFNPSAMTAIQHIIDREDYPAAFVLKI